MVAAHQAAKSMASRVIDFTVWELDAPTIIFILWFVVGFLVFEWLTSNTGPIEEWQGQMVTDHLQATFHIAPITWWLGLGAYLWLGPHIFWPALEATIKRAVGS